MKDEEKTKDQLIKELAELRQRLVDRGASEAQRKRAEWALGERVKESTCLYMATHDMQEDLSTDELCRRVIEHLVPAMQFPEITVPVIELNGRRFTSEKYTEGLSHSLHAEIRVGGEVLGHLWVYYAEDRPFLIPEEQNLVNGVAESLSLWLERKRAEEALWESEERYRTLFEGVPVGLYRTTPEGQIRDANLALVEMLGYPDQESLLAVNATDLYVNPEDRRQEQTLLEREGVVREFETQLRQRDGTVIWVKDTVRAVCNAEGRVLCYEGSLEDITKRKRAEETLRESEEQFRMVLESSMDNLYRRNLETDTYDYMSPAVERISGYSTEELLSMPLESVVSKMHPDDIDRVNRVMEESMTGDRAAWLLEYRFRHKDGQYHWLSDLFTVVRDEQGHPLYLVGNVHDITERKRAEEALRESERRLKEAQAMGRIGDWKFDIDNQKITWSDQVFELYERDPGLGAPTPEEEATYYSPEQARILREYAHRSIETGQEFEYDLEVKLPSGRTGYFSACMHPIKDESGHVVELFGTVQDITKRKRAEEALRESEERYRSLFDRVPVGLYRTTPAGQILDANPALVQMLGYPDQESLLAVSATDVYVNGRDRAREQALLEREEVVRHFETQMCRRDGAVIWVRDSVRAVRNADDRVLCYEGSLEDITKRKRAEEALRASETEKKAILNAMSDIVLFHNTDLSIQWGNEAARRSVGKTQQEVVGCYCYELWHGRSEPCERCPVLRALETGSHADGIMMTPDGRWWEITGEPVCDRDGKTVGAIEIAHDITKRKRTEEALRRHLERVEALREIDRAITSTLDLTEVLDVILGELKRVIPYHSAGIFLLSNGIARLAAGRGFPDLERVLQVSLSVKEDPLTREVLQKKRPLVLADAQADERFRARGGTAYVRSWIGVPMVAKGEAIGFLTIDHREPGVYDEENAEIAQGFASQAAIAIENARLYQETQRELAERKRAEEELQQSFEELRRAFEGTVTVLMSAVEMRDPYTAGHQRRVTQLACAIANEMALPQEQIEGIRLAGLIHDIGKINVPAEILSKPSQLTDLEFGLIKMHPQTGHNVLRAIEFPWPVAQIVLQHHERMDGSGYPQGLSGEEIILEAKILGVADVVEAMASHRPYRAARGIDEALEEISQNRDTLYDPKVVDACLRLFTEKGFKFE